MRPPYGRLLEFKRSKSVLLKMDVLSLKFQRPTQVVKVYLQLFWRNSLLKCAPQPIIAKNTNPPLFNGTPRLYKTHLQFEVYGNSGVVGI